MLGKGLHCIMNMKVSLFLRIMILQKSQPQVTELGNGPGKIQKMKSECFQGP